MFRVNPLISKVQKLYDLPSDFSEERRKIFFSLNKTAADIENDLASIEKDIDANFCILPYDSKTIVVMDV